jgi:hypothetical protein
MYWLRKDRKPIVENIFLIMINKVHSLEHSGILINRKSINKFQHLLLNGYVWQDEKN